MPSEKEWEKAARGTDQRRYPWGDKWDKSRFSYYSSGVLPQGPVGCFPQGASPYGAEDMLGNALEWTLSDMMPHDSSRSMGVVCGGDIVATQSTDPSKRLVVTWRNACDHDLTVPYVGFRCVKRGAGAR